jgi:hypothetical protein
VHTAGDFAKAFVSDVQPASGDPEQAEGGAWSVWSLATVIAQVMWLPVRGEWAVGRARGSGHLQRLMGRRSRFDTGSLSGIR